MGMQRPQLSMEGLALFNARFKYSSIKFCTKISETGRIEPGRNDPWRKPCVGRTLIVGTKGNHFPDFAFP